MKERPINSPKIPRRRLLKLASITGSAIAISSILPHRFNWATKSTSERFSAQSQPLEKAKISTSLLILKSFDFEVLTVDNSGIITDRRREKAQVFVENLDGRTSLPMVMIPAGRFMMGSPDAEPGNFTRSERPQREVQISPFLMGKYPVTQAQWRVIASLPKIERELNPEPSYFKGDDRPVEQVSWYDAVEFCQRLSQFTQKTYRLPTEAEWEYACRAGTTTPFYFGATLTSQIANYYGTQHPYAVEPETEYRKQTTPVGSFPPNAFGLYDLHGSIYEWCADAWHNNYEQAPQDGKAWTSEDLTKIRYRVLRGGGWSSEARHCRSAKRFQFDPNNRYSVIGMRLVLQLT